MTHTLRITSTLVRRVVSEECRYNEELIHNWLGSRERVRETGRGEKRDVVEVCVCE